MSLYMWISSESDCTFILLTLHTFHLLNILSTNGPTKMNAAEAFTLLNIEDRTLDDDFLYTIFETCLDQQPQNEARLLLAIRTIAEEKNSQSLKTRLASQHPPPTMDPMELLRTTFISSQIDSAQPDLALRIGEYEWKVHSDVFIASSSFIKAALERDFKVCAANQELGTS